MYSLKDLGAPLCINKALSWNSWATLILLSGIGVLDGDNDDYDDDRD